MATATPHSLSVLYLTISLQNSSIELPWSLPLLKQHVCIWFV